MYLFLLCSKIILSTCVQINKICNTNVFFMFHSFQGTAKYLVSSLKMVLDVVAHTTGFRPEVMHVDSTDDGWFKAFIILCKVGSAGVSEAQTHKVEGEFKSSSEAAVQNAYWLAIKWIASYCEVTVVDPR